MQRFEQRVVLVTGAASGIGHACVQRFLAEGARVVALDRDESALADAFRDFAADAPLSTHGLDISDEASVDQCFASLARDPGRIDVLCNNAGVAGADYSTVDDNDTANWRDILDINLLGTLFCTRAVARIMRAQRGGAIINTASVAGLRSGAGGNAYSASKAAVINLTQTSACDLGADGIRVNAVCPGLIRTGMTRPVFDYAAAHDKEHKLGARCELRRYGRPEEIAAAVTFLASDDASYITAQALPVDGGNSGSLNMPGMKV
ncbi:MAG: SDR family NAD(P)-dependent oxidoreductase [Salinisphaera sp.]|jgi:meso-butanediol dehydrogenase/(S,S)-butanediol dehydrogenase/diacetyl reductase|nr:SDR family NAD(P)-dependent oxidoreductase [Salinisphaera sp.]